MSQTNRLLEVIRGDRRGPGATIVRFLLGLLTPIYRTAVGLKNRKFDRAIGRQPNTIVTTVPIPVISVGNLTTGGTGKTPAVIWIAQMLASLELKVAIISRGYGGSPNALNDEAMEMQHRLPGVIQLQSPDRVRIAQEAAREAKADVIVMDDGFQHRRLHRDLDIVLIDATNPFGYGRLLPRGLLREPLSSLKRADAIVITRCDQVAPRMLDAVVKQIEAHNQSVPVFMTSTKPVSWLQWDGSDWGLEHLAPERLLAFCGIGNPDAFRKTLESIHDSPVAWQVFPDHHRYGASDFETLAAAADAVGATALVCTHKDLVKIGANQIGGLPVYALITEMAWQQDRQQDRKTFESLIKKTALGVVDQ